MARENPMGAGSGNAIVGRERGSMLGTVEFSDAVMCRLDDLVVEKGLEPVGLIKMDVEGAEVGVLRGATDVLARQRPIIYGEFNTNLMPAFGTTFADVGNVVGQFGYRAFVFVDRMKLVETAFEGGTR